MNPTSVCQADGCHDERLLGNRFCAKHLNEGWKVSTIAADDPALGPKPYAWTPTTSGFECLFPFGMYGQVVFDGSTQQYKWGVFGPDNTAIASGLMPSAESAQRAANTWSRSDELRRKVRAQVYGNIGP